MKLHILRGSFNIEYQFRRLQKLYKLTGFYRSRRTLDRPVTGRTGPVWSFHRPDRTGLIFSRPVTTLTRLHLRSHFTTLIHEYYVQKPHLKYFHHFYILTFCYLYFLYIRSCLMGIFAMFCQPIIVGFQENR